MIGKVTRYLSDVHRETKKVIWPTRSELMESSTVVVVLSLLMAIFVFATDYLLTNILKLIF